METRKWVFFVLAGMGVLLLMVPQVSAQDVRTGVEQLAAQIASGAPEGRQLRVAVADFPDLQNVTSDLGRYIASRLTTRLAQSPKFSVIERQRLSQVLAELKFSMSELVDPAKAKRLGQMAGVEAIVVGTVSDLGNQVDLDARMIEIETNRMLLGATVTISKDPTVDEMLKRGRQEGVGGPAGPGPAPTTGAAAPTPSGPGQPVSVEGFTFQPRGCRKTGGKLVCTVALMNTGSEQRRLILTTHEGQLIDNRGNQYRYGIATGNRQETNFIEEAFMPQLPVNVLFITDDLQESATHMSVVIGIRGFKKAPVVRDIPIAR